MARLRLSSAWTPCSAAALVVLAAAPLASARTSDAAESACLRAEGLHLGFNLDHAEALAAFRAAITANPEDPAPHRLAAATILADLVGFDGGRDRGLRLVEEAAALTDVGQGELLERKQNRHAP